MEHLPANPTLTFATRAVVAAILLAATHWLSVRSFQIEADLAETNYQANMIRIGNLVFPPGPPEAILAGTSVSGRLLPGFFDDAGMVVANMGLDGGSPVTALRLINQQQNLPPLVFLETHGLFRQPDANDAALLKIPENFSFRLSRWIAPMRASLRPSSLIYSTVKSSKDRHSPGRAGRKREPDSPAIPKESGFGHADFPELTAQIRSLQHRGVLVVLVHLPARYRVEDCLIDPAARALAEELGLSVLDTAAEMAQLGEDVFYSDGLHLIEPSARRVAALLARHAAGLGR